MHIHYYDIMFKVCIVPRAVMIKIISNDQKVSKTMFGSHSSMLGSYIQVDNACNNSVKIVVTRKQSYVISVM